MNFVDNFDTIDRTLKIKVYGRHMNSQKLYYYFLELYKRSFWLLFDVLLQIYNESRAVAGKLRAV